MNRRFLKGLALLMVPLALMLVVAGCAAPPGLPPSPGPPPSPISPDTELNRLVKRYLTYPGTPYGELEILVGELPSGLPVDVPIPEDAEVIGSIVRSDKYKSIQIMLDVPQQPDEIIEFYRDCLTEKGWEEMAQPSPSGFVSPMMRSRVNFCYGGKISLNLYAYPTEEGKPTDVRLHVNDDPQSYKAYTEEPVRPGVLPGDILPALLAPEGAIHHGGGAGGSHDRWYSQAMLETSFSTEELQAHYKAQLLEAGWKLKEEGAGETIAWSTWSVADDSGNDWAGLLLVRATKEDWRILYLIADLTP